MDRNHSQYFKIIKNRENPFTEMMKSQEKCPKNNQMVAKLFKLSTTQLI